jgi:hypothetical protein
MTNKWYFGTSDARVGGGGGGGLREFGGGKAPHCAYRTCSVG